MINEENDDKQWKEMRTVTDKTDKLNTNPPLYTHTLSPEDKLKQLNWII